MHHTSGLSTHIRSFFPRFLYACDCLPPLRRCHRQLGNLAAFRAVKSDGSLFEHPRSEAHKSLARTPLRGDCTATPEDKLSKVLGAQKQISCLFYLQPGKPPETVLLHTTLLQRVLRAHARASTSATPPNALEMPCDGDSTDEQKLTTTSNTFWSTQTAKYPNYGTTKKRRFHETNYLVENIQKMKEGDVVSLTDVGCGTGSTVTVLQELTDIKTYHC